MTMIQWFARMRMSRDIGHAFADGRNASLCGAEYRESCTEPREAGQYPSCQRCVDRAEIERLRAENERLRLELERMCAENERARAETGAAPGP